MPNITPDQAAAEAIGAALDRRISYLTAERAKLVPAAAAARVADIDAELAALQPEKARIDPRRPPGSPIAQGVSTAIR